MCRVPPIELRFMKTWNSFLFLWRNIQGRLGILFMRLESDVILPHIDFIAMVYTQFDSKNKVVWSDNRSEFVNKNCSELFKSFRGSRSH